MVFHRVIPGFMAQTGDVQNGDMEDGFNLASAGTGGSDLPNIVAELDQDTQIAPTLNSLFVSKRLHFLNNQYTVFGRVIEGMEFIDALVKGEPPEFPDKIISMNLSSNK